MLQIIKVTFALLGLFVLYAFLAGSFEEGTETGLYYAFFGAGALFFPVLIFVTLYHLFLGRRFHHLNTWLSLPMKSLLLILISFFGLFVWAILEFIVTSGFSLNWKEITADYWDEYLGYMPVVIGLALLIPPAHHFFQPRRKKGTA